MLLQVSSLLSTLYIQIIVLLHSLKDYRIWIHRNDLELVKNSQFFVYLKK